MRKTVRRNGTKVVVRKVVYKPELTLRRIPVTRTLKVNGLKSGAHKLRAVVSYSQTVKKNSRKITSTVSRALAIGFKVC